VVAAGSQAEVVDYEDLGIGRVLCVSEDLATVRFYNGQIVDVHLSYVREWSVAEIAEREERLNREMCFIESFADRRRFVLFREKRCTYCMNYGDESKGPDGHSWHVDHDIPESRGGPSSLDNLVLSCRSCNLLKGTKTGEEFLATFPASRLM
jgi:hypothetical protein